MKIFLYKAFHIFFTKRRRRNKILLIIYFQMDINFVRRISQVLRCPFFLCVYHQRQQRQLAVTAYMGRDTALLTY